MPKFLDHVSIVKPEISSPPDHAIETLEAETKLDPMFKLPDRTGKTKITIKSPHTGEPIIFKHERAGSSEDTFTSSSNPSNAEKNPTLNELGVQSGGGEATARDESITQHTDEPNQEKPNIDVDPLSKARAMRNRHGDGEISIEEMQGCVTMLYTMQDDLERKKTRLQEEVSRTGTLLGQIRNDSGNIAELLTSLSTKQNALEDEDRSFERELEILDAKYDQEKTRLSETHGKRREELEEDVKLLRGRLNSEIAWALDTLVVHSSDQSG